MKVYSSNNFDRDVRELNRSGYQMTGLSAFNAGTNSVTETQLRKHAETIGAQLGLVASKHTNTVNGALPLSIPKTTTTSATAPGTAVGPGRSTMVSGSGTSTTTGSQSVLMPNSITRADFSALYFVRVKSRLGLNVTTLDISTRLRRQSNFGVRIVVVVEGSPAFDADILPGDLLLQFGEDRVGSVEHFGNLVDKYKGKTVGLVSREAVASCERH